MLRMFGTSEDRETERDRERDRERERKWSGVEVVCVLDRREVECLP